MKDTGIEWLSKIPLNWSITKAKYVFKQRNEKGNKISLRLLSPTQRFGVIPQDEYEKLTGMKAVKLNEKTDYSLLKTIHKGDYCISLRSFQGGFEYSEYEGVVSPAYQVFFSYIPIERRFFKYIFKDQSFIEKMNSFTLSLRDGKNIAFDDFGNSYIPIPPFYEQQKIADFLDKKCSEIDALTSDIQTQIETLEEYKKSVITEAVTKGLDPNVDMKDSGIEWLSKIPLNWSITKAKYVFKQRNEKGNKISLRLLSPTQRFGVIPQDEYEKLTGMKAVKLNEKTDYSLLKTIHKGDYCISLRSFQGGFEYSEYEGVVSPAYQVFFSYIPIERRFFKYIFKDQSFIEKMNSFTLSLRDGKNIAFDDFGNSYIPIPPFYEQQKIADFLDKKCSEIDLTISEKQQQLETLANYKKSLIYEYVTGKKEIV